MLLTKYLALAAGGAPRNSFFTLFLAIFALVFITNLVYLACFRRFSRYLQQNHPTEAQNLNRGLGQSITNPSGRNLMMIYRYFWNKQYKAVNDETLNRYGAWTRGILILAIVLFALLFVSLIVSIAVGNK